MTINDQYNQAKKDYYRLCELNGGSPYDLTGGFVDAEAFEDLMKNPSKKTALSYYVDLIKYSAINGFEEEKGDSYKPPNLKDKKVIAIYKKYDCLDMLGRWQ